MKKLSGFSPVFRYTLKSHLKSKKFIILTLLVGIVFLIVAAIGFYFIAKPDENSSNKELSFKKVYVDLGAIEAIKGADLGMLVEALGYDRLADCEFETVENLKELAKAHQSDKDFLGVTLVKDEENENTYAIMLVKADENAFESRDLDELGDYSKMAVNQFILMSSGLTEQELMQVSLMVDYDVIGVESVDSAHIIAMIIVCMFVLMLVYFMALIYGAQISAEVSIEKTSKLVEQLMISVTPYGLITGKIIALIITSMVQFFCWIMCLFGGLFVGNAIIKATHPGYVSQFSLFFDSIVKWLGDAAASPLAWVLTVITILLGIAIYLVFAGVAGAMVTRPEETSSMQVVFILPMIVAFYIALYALINATSVDGGHLSLAYSLIPFVSAFVAPGAILTGEISILMGIVSIAISLAIIMLLFVLAAKVYKALMFYNGNGMNPVKAIKLLFNKSK